MCGSDSLAQARPDAARQAAGRDGARAESRVNIANRARNTRKGELSAVLPSTSSNHCTVLGDATQSRAHHMRYACIAGSLRPELTRRSPQNRACLLALPRIGGPAAPRIAFLRHPAGASTRTQHITRVARLSLSEIPLPRRARSRRAVRERAECARRRAPQGRGGAVCYTACTSLVHWPRAWDIVRGDVACPSEVRIRCSLLVRQR